MALTISPELQSLNPPLSPEARAQLEANVLRDGCLDALVVWQEEQILLDGHNRYAICEHHGLPYRIHELSLPDLDAAQLWIIDHQDGRRNLTPNQLSYLRGKKYEIQKRQGKRTDLTSGKSYQKLPNTATALAQDHQVSEKTIRNDFAYSKALDTLAETVGKEVLPQMRDRDHKLTQQDVKALAKLAPYAAREAIAAVREVKTPRQARQIVRAKVREARESQAYMDAIARSNSPEEDWPARLRRGPTPAAPRAWEQVYVEELGRRLTKALDSLDHLRMHLTDTSDDQDWLTVTLPALLEQQSARAITLARYWGQVEMLLRRSETVLEGIFADVGVPSSLRAATAAPPAPTADAPDCPAFDTAIYTLGLLCPEQHAWGQTGQTRRRISDHHCLDCDAAKARQQRQKRKDQQQAVGATA